jgi:hypothetical protein
VVDPISGSRQPPGFPSIQLSKNPRPERILRSPGRFFRPGPEFRRPDGDFGCPAGFLASRTATLPGYPVFGFPAAFFRSRMVIQRSRGPIFLCRRLSFFPSRHLRDPGRRVSIGEVILLPGRPSLFRKAHPALNCVRQARHTLPHPRGAVYPPFAHDMSFGPLNPANSLE